MRFPFFIFVIFSTKKLLFYKAGKRVLKENPPQIMILILFTKVCQQNHSFQRKDNTLTTKNR